MAQDETQRDIAEAEAVRNRALVEWSRRRHHSSSSRNSGSNSSSSCCVGVESTRTVQER